MALATAPLRAVESVVGSLVGPHGLDRYLELVHPMLTVRELRAQVTDVRRDAHSVTLTLRPNHRWDGFRAGQYVQVAVDVDGVRHTRCFSPACSEHRGDGRLELTIAAHDGGVVSRHFHAHARAGMVVGLTPPQGEFVLPRPRPERVLLISGGSGITPVLAMLRTLCDEGHRGPVTLLHYARSADHVGYLSELRRLAAAHDHVAVHVVHTRDDRGDLTGRFGAGHLAAAAPWYRDAETFLCGPASLTAAVTELYESQGLAGRLHSERFVLTPVSVPDGTEVRGQVRFAASGVRAANSGATLLEQAEGAGLTPEHGCRMGICFTCTSPKLSGCTRDLRTGELNTETDTEIQLCVSVPVGDVEIDI